MMMMMMIVIIINSKTDWFLTIPSYTKATVRSPMDRPQLVYLDTCLCAPFQSSSHSVHWNVCSDNQVPTTSGWLT
jgi:hypothetical protein